MPHSRTSPTALAAPPQDGTSLCVEDLTPKRPARTAPAFGLRQPSAAFRASSEFQSARGLGAVQDAHATLDALSLFPRSSLERIRRRRPRKDRLAGCDGVDRSWWIKADQTDFNRFLGRFLQMSLQRRVSFTSQAAFGRPSFVFRFPVFFIHPVCSIRFEVDEESRKAGRADDEDLV
jgi:hypothetical protein